MSSSFDESFAVNEFEPKLDLLPGVKPPDSFNGFTGKPLAEFVVARHMDGTCASVYADLTWNWTSYNPSGVWSPFYFDVWCNGKPTIKQLLIIEEMRMLMFSVIWLRDGKPFSYATLIKYFNFFLKMAVFVESKNSKIKCLLSDKAMIYVFIEEVGHYYATPLASLILILQRIDKKFIDFDVVPKKALVNIAKMAKKYKSSEKQHPVIPTRIYSIILNNFENELSDFENVSDQYLKLVKSCALDPLLGRSIGHQGYRKRRLGLSSQEDIRPEFSDLLRKFKLQEYFKLKGLGLNVKGLSKGLTYMQFTAKVLIHSYSGMRNAEVNNLSFDCLDDFFSGGKVHNVIIGDTTKLNNGKNKRTRWVTSKEGKRAIIVAQNISNILHEVLEVRNTNKSAIVKETFPLFISVNYLGFTGSRMILNKDRYLPSSLCFASYKDYIFRFSPEIDEEDINELELIDPHRAWRIESAFKIGVPWTLTSHQFRRSLALYATRSGLVSLPSLRRQLQHITEEMTMYYARGSASAKRFTENSHGFVWEYQNSQHESQALSYISNFLLSDERLFGAHGRWIERRDSIGDKIISKSHREGFMGKFRKGELSYKETALGGCAKSAPCNQRAMRSIVACLDCARAVIKLTKLNQVISCQESLVEDLDTNSLEWRMENDDLKALIVARDKYVGMSNDSE